LVDRDELKNKIEVFGRLLLEEMRISYRSKRFYIYLILFLLPPLFMSLWYFIFQYHIDIQTIDLKIFMQGEGAKEDILTERVNIVKGMRGISSGLYMSGLMGLLIAVISSEWVAGERHSGMHNITFSKFMSRSGILLARYIAFLIHSAIFVTIAILWVGVLVLTPLINVGLFFEAFSKTANILLIMIGVTILCILAYTSLATLFSVLSPRPMIAIIMMLIYTMVIVSIVSVIALIFGQQNPALYNLMYLSLSNDGSVVMEHFILGEEFWKSYIIPQDPYVALSVLIAVSVGGLVLACLLLETREFS